MSYYIYKFTHLNNSNIKYFPIRNKNINEIKYNIRCKRLKIDIDDVNNYTIEQLQQLKATNKNDAVIEFNNYMNKNNNKKKIPLDNLDGIIKKINELNIADLTKKNYIQFATNIFKIYYGFISATYSFDKIVKDISNFLSKMKDLYSNITTQREYIVKFLRIVKLLNYNKKIVDDITEIMYEYQDKHLTLQDKKRLFDTTPCTREDLLKKIKDLFYNNEIDEMILLILSTHILYPKRDDYKNIKMIYDDIDEDEIINDENITEKYDGVYIYNKNKFIIMKYKNSKTYKNDIFTVDNEFLLNVINECSELYPDRDLYYMNSKKEAYKSVSNIFRKYLGICLNDVRKILTKEKGIYKAKKELKHSANTSRTYYKRN
jgi:hypothetical protein